jgi:hypothetical protein
MSLDGGFRTQKKCLVHCGERCNCESASNLRGHYWPQPEIKEYKYEIGDIVLKFTGDYKAVGEIRGRFKMKNGAVRYVVEHRSTPEGSFCHIYSEANLTPYNL